MPDYAPTMADFKALALVEDPGLLTREDLVDMFAAVPLLRLKR